MQKKEVAKTKIILSEKHIGDLKVGELGIMYVKDKLILVTKDYKGRLKKIEFQDY